MASPSPQRPLDLIGKVAVITGASRGIGRAIALNLGSRGCKILGTCRSEAGLDLIKRLDFDLLKIHIGHEGLDHRDSEQTEDFFKALGINANIYSPTCASYIADTLAERFQSKVDIFINNAADPNTGDLGELTVEEIQKSLIGNIQTPVLIVDELVKRKIFQPNSRIIYISSIRSRQPWSGQLLYSAGKAAGESLCRTWSQAFGGKEEQVSRISFIGALIENFKFPSLL
jgi:3-oxoacyl-[acyl-carrier protein] reductase